MIRAAGMDPRTAQVTYLDPRDDLLADAPSSPLATAEDTVDPVVAQEVVEEMAHAVVGNVGAVDGDPVAADEESA